MNAPTPRSTRIGKRDRTLKSEHDSSEIEEAAPAANDSDVVEVAEGTERASTASESDRHGRIALAAYYRANVRGFEPGHELDDWLAAEREIDATVAANDTGRRSMVE